MAVDPLLQQQPRRLKGILALLPRSAYHFPYNEDAWRSRKNHQTCSVGGGRMSHKQLRRRQRQRFREENDVENAVSTTENSGGSTVEANNAMGASMDVPLADHIGESDVAILFLFDPYQQYSRELLQKLVSICQYREEVTAEPTTASHPNARGGRLLCLACTQCPDTAAVTALLRYSGVYLLSTSDDTFAGWRLAAGVDRCPCVTVVECGMGRNVTPNRNEERALDLLVHPYQDAAAAHAGVQVIRDAWMVQHKTALSVWQQVGVALMVPVGICSIQ